MSLPNLDTANVRPLHRQRVLLATTDGRFLRIAGFLLAREGYEVSSTRKPGELMDDVDRHAPDVVVLDTGDSLALAARTLAAIEALHRHVRVFLVCEDGVERRSKSFRLFPKWTSMNELMAEIEQASFGSPSR